ncbi:Copia protein [Trachymyrmex cornetzi]|uniref:Copia protein n=1 Tax=Trachymyrmex cornetzi TaxID=471704 RepID=A0A151IZG8_9HYME|nr:Copia protein [Trachymyrmex cornetzi]
MSESTDLRNITKFDGQNFQLWKFQIRTIFVAHDLLRMVQGEEVKPEIAGDLCNDWTRRNAKAMFILSSMEYFQLEYLITRSTATEMWTKVSAIHEQKSVTNRLSLTTKFHEYRMATGDSVIQHITKIENMANQLKDIDERISDVMIMAKILGTLPPKYNAFISAWDSVNPTEQTLPLLRERLIREEARMTSTDEISNALATTTLSTESKQGHHHRRFSKDTCKKKIVCSFCSKTGHLAKYCFAKKRALKERHNDKTTESKRDDSANLTADVWLLDSGASRHLCCRREWFTDFSSCNDERVYLGDNTITI